MRHPRRVLAGALIALLFAAAGVRALEPRQKPERATPLLAVDFMAVSRDGTPVAGLTAADVTVRIGGRARLIRALQLVSEAPAGAAASGPAGPLPPPFGSNAASDRGRALVLAIDNDSFRPGREAPLREAVDLLLQRLTSRDRLALVTMPYGGIKVPFTIDHEQVRRALASIVGNAPPNETGSALACRTRETLEELLAYFTTLGVRDEPVILMFITSGLAAPRHDAPLTVAPGICELRSELFRQVGVAAGAARAHFYVIQPGDAFEHAPTLQRENIAGAGYLGSDNPIEGIEHLAGVTGGKILQLTGSPDTALGRVLRETAAHYLAAIDPAPNDRSGRSQQLEVRVARPGIEVRARPHITFPRPAPSLGRPSAPSPREMLAMPALVRDLPLRAAAFVSPGPDARTARVLTVAEPAEAGVTFTVLMAALIDTSGKAVSHWIATAEELQRTPVLGAMPVPPGAYRLRVAAVGADGRGGSVDYALDTELATTGPLTLSSLVLGLSRGGTFIPKLQFRDEPVAIGYLELYGGAAGLGVKASLELARSLNGPAMLAVPLAIETTGDSRWVSKGAIPIAALPPGDYIVRAVVGAQGHPPTRVVRTLRKGG